jgi:predicted PhzF superfamily epimerase YddE/YHI9
MDNFCISTVFHQRKNGLKGNTAAVVLLEKEWTIPQMQEIAEEFQQPATSFLNRIKPGHYHVHWFAPDGQIDLCGHGSLAVANFLKEFHNEDKATLHYEGGNLEVGFEKGQYFVWLDPIEVIDHGGAPVGLEAALGAEVHDYFSTSNKDIVVLKSEQALRDMQPNFKELATLEPFGYAVTAPGDTVDFVSRTLVPKVQQLEDHATGSSHAALTPFWSERLLKYSMKSLQLSPRGGAFTCEMHLNKVLLKGNAHLWVRGRMQ